MNLSDPIADMLTRIRNANAVRHENVDVPYSKIKGAIAEILKQEGFVREIEVMPAKQGAGKVMQLKLNYGPNREQVITGLKRISKPGLRVYAGKDELPRVLGGLGVAILSTSQGILTDKECRKRGIGGEVLCYVW